MVIAPMVIATVMATGAIGKQAATSAPVNQPAEVRIIADTVLPISLVDAVDVRWADEHSIFLALARKGVVETPLDLRAPAKIVVPGEDTPGGFWMSFQVGASRDFVVAGAGLLNLTWVRRGSSARREATFEGIHDLDVQADRLAVVGVRRDDQGRFAPEGAIAWMGSLADDLRDLKPIVFDARFSGAPTFNACIAHFLGAVRFMIDGSLVVLPGVQPGIQRFDRAGKLVRSWDTVSLGIDSDCGALSKDEASQLKSHFPRRHAWINQRSIVDDILALPKGPGLLVRRVSAGHAEWVLKVLEDDGSVASFALPIHGTDLAHVKGDVRGDRLVLLQWEYTAKGTFGGGPPHLLVASIPHS